MPRVAWATLSLVVLALAGCMSPEEQRQADMQVCYGYGFTPSTNAFAQCMMQTAQQRSAQRAAAQRQQSYNDMIARQAQHDRDDQAARNQAAQDAAHEASVDQMMGHPTQTVAPGIDIPKVEAPQISMPDMSGMHCTGSSGENAGSMSCSN